MGAPAVNGGCRSSQAAAVANAPRAAADPGAATEDKKVCNRSGRQPRAGALRAACAIASQCSLAMSFISTQAVALVACLDLWHWVAHAPRWRDAWLGRTEVYLVGWVGVWRGTKKGHIVAGSHVLPQWRTTAQLHTRPVLREAAG